MAAGNHHGNGNHPAKPRVAVVAVPLPAQGHLNQLLYLSHRLVSATGLSVYYAATTTHIRQAKLRAHGWGMGSGLSTTSSIHFHEFPTLSFSNPEPNPRGPTKFPAQLVPLMYASMDLRGPLFSFVNDLSVEYERVVVICDSLMAYVVQDVNSIWNAESYCFLSVSAFCVNFLKWDMSGRPDLPDEGEIGPILRDFPGMDDFFNPEFSQYRKIQRGYQKSFSGDIFNSSRVIEGSYLDYVAKGVERQWAIGPFNPVEVNNPEKNEKPRSKHECLDWLDQQDSPGSVILVSFGTTTSISDEQIKELAIGLEKSMQKFIWVLREADKGDIFTGESRKPVLPDGFEERVKERGIVLREWAPQLEILSHYATGGFMSHCGWNSCMESLSMGVPIATWPMHSDQPVNAVLVTKVLRVGVEVKGGGDEVVSSGVVEKAVRRLMGCEEGDEIRKRARDLGVRVRDSVKEGGVSNQEFESFIAHITR